MLFSVSIAGGAQIPMFKRVIGPATAREVLVMHLISRHDCTISPIISEAEAVAHHVSEHLDPCDHGFECDGYSGFKVIRKVIGEMDTNLVRSSSTTRS